MSRGYYAERNLNVSKRKSPIYELSAFQLISLTASSCFPLTFFFFPRTASQYAGIDSEYSALGVCLVLIYIAFIHGALNERFAATSGADMPTYAYGKKASFVVDMSFLWVYVFFVAMSINGFAQTIQMLFWPHTPVLALTLSLILVSMVGALYGLETLARVSAIVYPLTWLGVGVMFLTACLQGQWYGIPTHIANFANTTIGLYKLLPLALGFNVFLLFSPYYEHRKNRTLYYPMLSMLAGCLLLLFGMMASILTMRWTAVQQVAYPIPLIFQLIRFHGWIIEKSGLFILVFATLFIVLFVSIHLWGLCTLITRMYNRPDSSYRKVMVMLAVIMLGISVGLSEDAFSLDMIDQYLVPASWLTLVLEPTVKLLTTMIRGKKSPRISPRRQQTQGEL